MAALELGRSPDAFLLSMLRTRDHNREDLARIEKLRPVVAFYRHRPRIDLGGGDPGSRKITTTINFGIIISQVHFWYGFEARKLSTLSPYLSTRQCGTPH